MSGKGLHIFVGPWLLFLNWHSTAGPRTWGYRNNPNHGNPVRTIMLFWCEASLLRHNGWKP